MTRQSLRHHILLAFCGACCLAALSVAPAMALAGKIPVPGMVTMVDLGAKKCVPCKMMAPILEALEKEYQGRAAIVFIDVWENPEAAKEYGIQVIPTQIFYDAGGREVLRHQGFMSREAIVAQLGKIGVK